MSKSIFFEAEVTNRIQLTPAMTRIELGGAGLNSFVSSGYSDEWVYLKFPVHETSEIPTKTLSRAYTVRKWLPQSGVMYIDFAAHEDGVAAQWAMSARPGTTIPMSEPFGRFKREKTFPWVLLIADVTGLPAVGRILEELPSNVVVTAHIELPDMADRQVLTSTAQLSLYWHDTFGKCGSHSDLYRIAKSAILQDHSGYIWIAGEATMASQSRKYFRDILGFDKERIDAIGYWINGQARG